MAMVSWLLRHATGCHLEAAQDMVITVNHAKSLPTSSDEPVQYRD